MQAADTEVTLPFYWDKFRYTTLGRYLFQREHAFINRFLNTTTQPRRLLDVSCGSGRISLPLHSKGLKMVGLDLDPKALVTFRRQSKEIPLIRSDAQHLPFQEGSFDCLVAIQCFEYFNHCQFLQGCNWVLHKDGLLIFDFLNRHSYKWILKQLSGRRLELPSANLSCREVLRAIADHGFDIQAVSGYNWAPFTRESNSALVGAVARIEQIFQLERYYNVSPKILVAARKRG